MRVRKLLGVVPVLIAIGLAVLLVALRSGPERIESAAEQARVVRVYTVKRLDVVPRVLGYGSVRPARVWDALAEVGGKITYIHPKFEAGAVLQEGEVLVEIDAAEYRLLVSQREATLRTTEAQLAELDVEEQSLRSQIEIQRRSLELSENDLKRNVELVERGSVSESLMEQVERDVLAQRNQLQSLQSSLAAMPAKREQLESQRALNQAQLEDARIDLGKTRLTTPFACRIAEKYVERKEYVPPGTRIAVADSIDRAEVTAQLSLDQLYPLIERGQPVSELRDADVRQVVRRLGLSAVVRVRSGSLALSWPAEVALLSPAVDAQTRTVGVIVAVDEPYAQARIGERPALVKGMFCEVELSGRARPGLVIPRAALHQDRVYVVNAEDRLESRPVKLEYAQRNFVVVAEGLSDGEHVVLSDLQPAIDGMLLAPQPDGAAEASLEAEIR
jgi:RND family efflux transporter MFP subunit